MSATTRHKGAGNGKRKITGERSNRMIELSHQAIAIRAYGIWLQQGRPHGQAMANWLRAEDELRLAESEGDVE